MNRVSIFKRIKGTRKFRRRSLDSHRFYPVADILASLTIKLVKSNLKQGERFCEFFRTRAEVS
jgi:hypothetical protein